MTAAIHFMVPGDIAARTGGTGYDRRLLAELQRRGLPITLVPLSGRFPYPDEAGSAGAEAAFSAVPDGGLALVDGLAYGVLGPLAARHRRRIGIVALCHHPLGYETGLDRDLAAELVTAEELALRHADAVVVTSTATAETLIFDFAVPLEKITVALPGTDRRAAAPGGGSPPRLVTVASLIPRKAHDVLVEALDRIRDRPFSADFVGGESLDPGHARRIRQMVEARGLADRIRIHGAVEDPEPFYLGADLFVLPSLYEGYGMAFAEALAHGLPIVAARAGAVPDVVPPSAGILVEPGDAAALSDAIAGLLDDPARITAMRAAARQAALRLQTWDDTAAQVAALLERVRPAVGRSNRFSLPSV